MAMAPIFCKNKTRGPSPGQNRRLQAVSLDPRTGVQHRKNSWQDGVLGANCPSPAGWNWTYQFQVKDQIGSFFYFPSLDFQRAAGGYGGIIINNRDVIPLPFAVPDGDITIFISDWYTKSHKKLRKDVENGVDLGVPDGILINGLGPYRYDAAIVPDSIPYQDQAQRIYSSGAPSVVDASRTVLLAFVMALFGYLISREMSWMVVNVETEKMVSCHEDEVGFKIPSDI
ncbi:hypothetical protein KPL71_004782 [Citrus sinensis]|uniref:Uncharacterized protein n=1 Tax=Citrus sinensis TaxID=2711 RepID=A0ACB8N7Z5_CITSI|nr:hypothetical protein KPL71_004782 [Citrus sinensis]